MLTRLIVLPIPDGFACQAAESDEIPLIFDLLVYRILVVNIPLLEEDDQDLEIILHSKVASNSIQTLYTKINIT